MPPKADKEQLFEMLNQPSSIETTNGTEDVSSFELENVIKQHILSIFEEEKESILTNLFNKIE